MSLDAYVTLGRSGLRVSPLTLGAMTFGEDWGWGCTPEEAHGIMDHYIGLGGNIIDTANAYTNGHSEAIIGDYLRARPGLRDRLVLSTKGGMNMHAGDPNAGGAAAKNLISACDQSLRRLGTDYIDLYWMHQPDPFTPVEETIRALHHLVEAGKIRYIGFSDMPAWRTARAQTLAELRGWSPIIAMQFEYSLLERSVEHELIPMARDLGIGGMPWGPLKSGVLSGKYARASEELGRARQMGAAIEQAGPLIEALQEIAKRRNASIAAVAIAWVSARPGVDSVLIGARTLDQLKGNLAASALRLDGEEIAGLDAISQPADTFISSFQRTAQSAILNGCTVNGVTSPRLPIAPGQGAKSY